MARKNSRTAPRCRIDGRGWTAGHSPGGHGRRTGAVIVAPSAGHAPADDIALHARPLRSATSGPRVRWGSPEGRSKSTRAGEDRSPSTVVGAGPQHSRPRPVRNPRRSETITLRLLQQFYRINRPVDFFSCKDMPDNTYRRQVPKLRQRELQKSVSRERLGYPGVRAATSRKAVRRAAIAYPSFVRPRRVCEPSPSRCVLAYG